MRDKTCLNLVALLVTLVARHALEHVLSPLASEAYGDVPVFVRVLHIGLGATRANARVGLGADVLHVA